jgi:dipeptidyl-peptidase-4
VAYVYENNIWLHHLDGGPEEQAPPPCVVQLTRDGLPGHGGMAPIINGNFDWVYEEELSLHDGWRWSPDGSKIAFWQLHTDGVESFPIVDLTSCAPYARVMEYPYPKSWFP